MSGYRMILSKNYIFHSKQLVAYLIMSHILKYWRKNIQWQSKQPVNSALKFLNTPLNIKKFIESP